MIRRSLLSVGFSFAARAARAVGFRRSAIELDKISILVDLAQLQVEIERSKMHPHPHDLEIFEAIRRVRMRQKAVLE